MNVTFVYRYLTLGGVEVVLRSRASGLGAFGIQPTLWFLSDGPGRSLFDAAPATVRIGGVDALRGHLHAGGVDLIAVIDTPEALESLPAAPRRPRVVIEVHTPYPENRTYLRSNVGTLADAVFVPSVHQGRIVRREMPRAPQIREVPNPIGAAFENPLVYLAGNGVGPVVAWVGRLDWLKNWRGFLQTARRVMHHRPDAEFWVVGSGTRDAESEFVRVCRNTGLLPRVRWLRGLPHAAIPRLHDIVRSSGGVVVSTSRGESFGMAIAEAMARSCAVVVPHMGPFLEFIAHDVNGRLYRPGSDSHASEEILQLLEEAETRARLGGSARERILRLHGVGQAMGALAYALMAVAGQGESAGAPRQAPRIDGQATRLGGRIISHSHSQAAKPLEPGRLPPTVDSKKAGDRNALFSGYYASGFWPGPGSSVRYTEHIRKEIPKLLRMHGIRTILDAPCGNYGWFRLIERDSDIEYIGGDIVGELMAANQAQFGDARTRFEVVDITSDKLPLADLWLCRDCLFHFSDADIFSTLENFLRSDIRYLLTTTHPECLQNTDIPTGSFRLLNLEIPPFSFEAPIERMDDWIEGHPVRHLALWEKASIARALGSRTPAS